MNTEDREHRPKHQPGFVYVAELSVGNVKVGMTTDLGRRQSQHEYDASRFGATILQWWGSEELANPRAVETELIAKCAEVAHRQVGRETFFGVGFHEAVEFARDIPREPTEWVALPTPEELRRATDRFLGALSPYSPDNRDREWLCQALYREGITVRELFENALLPVARIQEAVESGELDTNSDLGFALLDAASLVFSTFDALMGPNKVD